MHVDSTDANPHGDHNDLRGAAKAIDKWPHELFIVAAYNVMYGSKYSPAIQRQLIYLFKDHMQLMTHETRPIFQNDLHRILRGMGMLGRIQEELVVEGAGIRFKTDTIENSLTR